MSKEIGLRHGGLITRITGLSAAVALMGGLLASPASAAVASGPLVTKATTVVVVIVHVNPGPPHCGIGTEIGPCI